MVDTSALFADIKDYARFKAVEDAAYETSDDELLTALIENTRATDEARAITAIVIRRFEQYATSVASLRIQRDQLTGALVSLTTPK